eukprot:4958445-Ditylum_brightwellii.AAC.1
MASRITPKPPLATPNSSQTPTPTTCPQRAPTWKDGSAKHNELIALCEQKQWINLPALGGDVELDTF